MPMDAPTTARPPPTPLFFHELNLSDVYAFRKRAGTNFELAECRAKKHCVPEYLRSWQAAISRAVAKSLPLRWRGACAVVGSSNSLMHTPRGRAIDAAAAVFRINAAPTAGFERHTGKRTTLRFWGAPTAPGPTTRVVWGTSPNLPAASEPDVLPVCVCPPVKWVDRCWSELATTVPGGANATNATSAAATTLTPSQLRAVSAPRLNPGVKFVLREQLRAAAGRKLRYGQHPTTGAVAVFVALHACEHVALFGFGNCSATALARGRYYDRHLGRKAYLRNLATHHDYEAEQRWMRALVLRGEADDPEGCLSVSPLA